MKGVTLTIIIIILISIVVTSIIILKEDESTIGEVFQKKVLEKFQTDEKNSNEKSSSDTDIETVKSGSSGGGGGGGSGSSAITGCPTRQISYALLNPIETSTCTAYQGEVCVNKVVNCSVTVKNRDDLIGGFFQIELVFFEKGGDYENPFDVKTERFNIPPGADYRFKGSTEIGSIGEDGLANKVISCFYKTLEVPAEEFC